MKPKLALAIAFLLAPALTSGQTRPTNTSQSVAPIPTLHIAPPPRPEPEKTLEFPIGEGVGRGDVLVIPVKIGGKEHLFEVDTGCDITVIDSTLAQSLKDLLGSPVSKRTFASAAGGNVELPLYRFPILEAAGQRLKTSGPRLATVDMELMREANGRPVEGILGRDVLSQYVVRLNFRQHVLEFIDPQNFQSPKDNATTVFEMIDSGSGPGIWIPFAGLPNVLVAIDSGDNGLAAITSETLQRIPPAEVFEMTSSKVADVSGNVESKVAYIKRKWFIANTRL